MDNLRFSSRAVIGAGFGNQSSTLGLVADYSKKSSSQSDRLDALFDDEMCIEYGRKKSIIITCLRKLVWVMFSTSCL